MEETGEMRFQVGDIVVLNESWTRRKQFSKEFRGQVLGYSDRAFDFHGRHCVRIKRLDLARNRTQIWAQSWLEKENSGGNDEEPANAG